MRGIATCITALGVCAAAACADGYLWLGSEFQAEGTIFRYNLQTGQIDRTVAIPRPAGVGHWNNMATDGRHVYIGAPGSQYVGVCDPDTGAVLDSYTYDPSLSGHKEDGAYRPDTGNLWRVTFSSSLHEVTTDGQLVRSFTGGGALVGLEWVGQTLYATNYSGGRIGELVLDEGAGTAAFVTIPWAAGGPTISETAALAYDARDGVLYMAANRHHLWTVTFANGQATATHVADLSQLGYPTNGLIDGMGWIALPCAPDWNGDGVLSAEDFFAFLTDFFDGEADYDASGATTSEDFFAFLNDFFAGC